MKKLKVQELFTLLEEKRSIINSKSDLPPGPGTMSSPSRMVPLEILSIYTKIGIEFVKNCN